jgi:mRNA interferase MazF
VKRGEVRWYTFKAPDKRRPVLVLTRDTALSFLNAVTVAPITKTIREIPSELYLNKVDGMSEPCAANLDNILTVPKTQVDDLITTLSFEKMLEAEKAIRFALGFVGLV